MDISCERAIHIPFGLDYLIPATMFAIRPDSDLYHSAYQIYII